jgi:hypothetical protein
MKMENKLTIQAVSGAIRTVKGISTSRRYTGSSSRNIRSIGAYAEQRRFSKEIIIDYWTSGYKHAGEASKREMPKVIEALEARGFKVVTKHEPFGFGCDLMQEVLVVELA